MVQIIFYSDPGHGWGKVSRSIIGKLNLEEKISPYSYQKDGYVYLEEDVDLGVLISTLKAEEIAYTITKRDPSERPSRIRNYSPFRPRA